MSNCAETIAKLFDSDPNLRAILLRNEPVGSVLEAAMIWKVAKECDSDPNCRVIDLGEELKNHRGVSVELICNGAEETAAAA